MYTYKNNCYVGLKCKSIEVVISRDTILKHCKVNWDVLLCICSFAVLHPDSDTISHYNPLKAHYIHAACDLYVSAPGNPANGSIRFLSSSELLDPAPGSSDIDYFHAVLKALCVLNTS